MSFNEDSLEFEWLTWQQIEPYKELIAEWENETVIKYHYPDKIISKSYFDERIEKLKNYLNFGNTFFLGIFYESKLIGYYWSYVMDFLFQKTWFENSSYLDENFRGKGIGLLMKKLALNKALEIGCTEAKSMYAPFNKAQENLFLKLGFKISRIEVTKRLK